MARTQIQIAEDVSAASAASKVTPVDADSILLVDSAAADVIKKVTFENLKSAIGGGAVSDTKANILASTEDAGVLALSTDTEELFGSLGGGAWVMFPFAGVAESANPDMGAGQDYSRIGYGVDYVTDKTIYNSAIGGNSDPKNGAIRIDTSDDPDSFEIYMRSQGWFQVIYDLTMALGYFAHTPLSEPIYVWRGDSVSVGANGRPIISEYQVSMGAYPPARTINGGSF